MKVIDCLGLWSIPSWKFAAGKSTEVQLSQEDIIDEDSAPRITDFIPRSLSHFRLVSKDKGLLGKELKLFFRDFATKKEAHMPALEEIEFVHHEIADQAYSDECARLRLETEKAGVVLREDVKTWNSFIEWEGRWKKIKFPEPRQIEYWNLEVSE